jgi:glycosyltransferase involved in cell wall biosynthesis
MLAGLQPHTVYLAVNKGSNKERLNIIKEQYPKIKVVEIQARGLNIFRWLYDVYRLSCLIKAAHIDIISAQQRTSGIWAWLLQMVTKIPFVVTMHDSWHRALFKKSYSKIFHKIVVVGTHLEKVLLEQFGFRKQQIALVNNGIDINQFVPQDKLCARENLGIQANAKVVLHVSRLSSIKGAVALAIIGSLPIVLEKISNIKLIIIGEGPLRDELEKKAQEMNRKYGSIIEVRDFTNNIQAWYNAADMIIGEGRVAIESLACERPVVAIRNNNKFFGIVTQDNVAEAIRVNFDGNTYPVNETNLANEIIKSSSITIDECKQTAKFIRNHMGIDSMVAKYLEIFETVLLRR